MQTLNQKHDQGHDLARSQEHPMMRGLMADKTMAYADEVRVLRQRVALLEAELAATKAARAAAATHTPQPPPLTTIDFAVAAEPEPVSVFTEQLTPAVAAALPAAPTRAAAATTPAATAAPEAVAPDQVAPAPNMSDPGFAEAWTSVEDDPSFEERVAERAFFQESTVDEESRSWLLAE